MTKRTVHQVREEAGASLPPNWGPAIRVVCRMDMHQHLQRFDWSIVAWAHPNARVILNELQANTGPAHSELELTLMFSHLAGLFDLFADPFPDAGWPPRLVGARGAFGVSLGEPSATSDAGSQSSTDTQNP